MATGLPKGNVFTGARARFTIDAKAVGYATQVSGSEEIMYESIDVLDHVQTVEYVPVGYRSTFSAGRVRLIGDAAGNGGSLRGPLNVFPKLGKDDSEHLLNILNMGDISCQVEDSISNKIFALFEQVRVAGHDWAITPRGIVGQNISFLGIRTRDEAEI